MNTPKVSVIMPVYNAEKYVSETVDSILNQTFKNFEFIVVDDGSTDKSLEILNSYKDERLKVYKNESNIGYVRTLNKLIGLAKGEYIARQDNDDISHHKRLERQVIFLDKNKDVGVCGSTVDLIGNRRGRVKMPLRDDEIRAYLIMNTPLLHPAVMIRKSILANKGDIVYDESFCPAEDYALWFEISKNAKLANLPESLLQYRMHGNNVSQLKQNVQIDKANQIRKAVLKYSLSIELAENEEKLYEFLIRPIELCKLNSIEDLFLKILDANKKQMYYKHGVLKDLFFQFWTVACIQSAEGSLFKRLSIYFSSKLFSFIYLITFVCNAGLKKISYSVNSAFGYHK